MNNWNSENIKLFEQIIDRAERGFYLDGKTLTDLYISIFAQQDVQLAFVTDIKHLKHHMMNLSRN